MFVNNIFNLINEKQFPNCKQSVRNLYSVCSDFPALLFITLNSVTMADNCEVTSTLKVSHNWKFDGNEIFCLKQGDQMLGKIFSPLSGFSFQLAIVNAPLNGKYFRISVTKWGNEEDEKVKIKTMNV